MHFTNCANFTQNTHKFYANISQNYTKIRKITQNDTNTQNNTLGQHTQNSKLRKFQQIQQNYANFLRKFTQNCTKLCNCFTQIAQNYLKLRKFFEQNYEEITQMTLGLRD